MTLVPTEDRIEEGLRAFLATDAHSRRVLRGITTGRWAHGPFARIVTHYYQAAVYTTVLDFFVGSHAEKFSHAYISLASLDWPSVEPATHAVAPRYDLHMDAYEARLIDDLKAHLARIPYVLEVRARRGEEDVLDLLIITTGDQDQAQDSVLDALLDLQDRNPERGIDYIISPLGDISESERDSWGPRLVS